MGFWRVVGYLISIVFFIIPGLLLLGSIWGIVPLALGIIFVYVLRKGAKDEQQRNDIRDLTDLAYSKNKNEIRVISDSDYKKYLEDKEGESD